MQLKKYGVTLDRFTAADLEQARQWRNAAHVRRQMHYRELITPEQQQAWFSALDPHTNFYFIISHNNRRAGVVNLKNVNYAARQAEAGIFIGEPEFLNTPVPVAATLVIMEFAFETLELHTLKAKIGDANDLAIRFNRSIGYSRDEGPGDDGFHYYSVSKEAFVTATEQLRHTLQRL